MYIDHIKGKKKPRMTVSVGYEFLFETKTPQIHTR